MSESFYLTDAGRPVDPASQSLPTISLSLDSVRTYQFEVHLTAPALDGGTAETTDFVLAAKQVTALGFSTEAIEVHRVNDKVFYPGKASPEEVTVTFDNLYNADVATDLWKWFKKIYNPTTGKFNESGGSDWKAPLCKIFQLDSVGKVIQETHLIGVYPQAWKTAEFNYGTNEFHTIEMTLRYDFMDHIKSA